MFDTMNFEDFSFEVIDVSITGTPDIHITQNGITFTRRLVEDMGYPPYVTPMIDAKNRAFAIKECRSTNEHAICFSQPKGEQKGAIATSSTAIRRMIRGVMGDQWQNTNRYYVTGIWYAEAKAMVFDLNAAKELPPFLKPGRNAEFLGNIAK
jgi:hypothetical protein